MDRPRKQLLAGACLPLNQNWQVGRRGLPGEVAELGHLLAGVDQLLEPMTLRLESRVLVLVKEGGAGNLEFAGKDAMTPRQFTRLKGTLYGQPQLC